MNGIAVAAGTHPVNQDLLETMPTARRCPILWQPLAMKSIEPLGTSWSEQLFDCFPS